MTYDDTPELAVELGTATIETLGAKGYASDLVREIEETGIALD